MPELRRALSSRTHDDGNVERRRTRGPWQEREIVMDFEFACADGYQVFDLMPSFSDDGGEALTREQFYARG